MQIKSVLYRVMDSEIGLLSDHLPSSQGKCMIVAPTCQNSQVSQVYSCQKFVFVFKILRTSMGEGVGRLHVRLVGIYSLPLLRTVVFSFFCPILCR